MSKILSDMRSYEYLLKGLGNGKKRKYVELRTKGALPLPAARQAGFPDPLKAAERMEKDLEVRTAIEYGVRVSAHEARVTRDDVIAGLKDAVAMATTASEMVQAWREIGKLIGAYEPTRIELSGQIDHNTVTELPDEKLLELAAIDGEFLVLDDETDDVQH